MNATHNFAHVPNGMLVILQFDVGLHVRPLQT